MNTQTTSKLVVAVFVVIFVAACSSSGKLTVKHDKAQTIPVDKTVALLVEPSVKEPKPVHKDVANRVRSALFGRLVADQIFQTVVHKPNSADYDMSVKIHGARKVSGAARFWLGVFAGSNNLRLAVQLHERATKKLVTEFEVVGESAAHPFSSEAGLSDAVREAVDKVITALR